MDEEEINSYKEMFPGGYIPPEIVELLNYSRGFEFSPLDEVRFDTYGQFGFEEMFPHSVPLAGDGFGNFWIIDIDTKGNWNSVYYVCHDPAVIVKHSENLSEFIEHIDEFGKKGNESNLDMIHEKIVFDIWNTKSNLKETNTEELDLKDKMIDITEPFYLASLKEKPIKTGFSWGVSGPNTKIMRLNDDPVWILEKKTKQGLFSKLFSKK
jgi:hypothetical protein